MSNTEHLESVLKDAVVEAINRIGMSEFKKTSFFLRNNRKQEQPYDMAA